MFLMQKTMKKKCVFVNPLLNFCPTFPFYVHLITPNKLTRIYTGKFGFLLC